MRARRAFGLAAVGALILTGLPIAAPTASAGRFDYDDFTPMQKRLASGVLTEAFAAPETTAKRPGGFKTTTPRCDGRIGSNIKVNQNCVNMTDAPLHGRSTAQNETWISVNPGNSRQIVAGYNDYRRGDGTCGVSYSADGGRRWNDATVPNGFTDWSIHGEARQYWQAGGDPSLAWDSRGNAYLSCLQFNRGAAVSSNPDESSGLYLFRSTGTGGASWNFAGRPTVEHSEPGGGFNVFHDKQLMTVDANKTSEFRDRIYVTWTIFTGEGTAYIFAAHSADYGQSFSDPVLVSSDSDLCENDFGAPTPQGRCNANQFSQPFVGPDGTLHVVWNNYNNAVSDDGDNHNQVLYAKSTDGGVTFSEPVKAADFHDLPDCATYQGGANAGRACVPEKGETQNSIFRAANYPYGSVDPRDPDQIMVTFGSYISESSQESAECTPQGFAPTGQNRYDGVKDGGCNNAIVLSESGDGGAGFTGTTTDVRELPLVSSGRGQADTDQFFHGMDVSPSGKLAVAYYDRQVKDANDTGFSDIVMSVRTRGDRFSHRRVTGSSMAPTNQFDGLFWGDYIAVSATHRVAYPIWSDTRTDAVFLCPGTGEPGKPPKACTGEGVGGLTANDQEIFTAKVPLR